MKLSTVYSALVATSLATLSTATIWLDSLPPIVQAGDSIHLNWTTDRDYVREEATPTAVYPRLTPTRILKCFLSRRMRAAGREKSLCRIVAIKTPATQPRCGWCRSTMARKGMPKLSCFDSVVILTDLKILRHLSLGLERLRRQRWFCQFNELVPNCRTGQQARQACVAGMGDCSRRCDRGSGGYLDNRWCPADRVEETPCRAAVACSSADAAKVCHGVG